MNNGVTQDLYELFMASVGNNDQLELCLTEERLQGKKSGK